MIVFVEGLSKSGKSLLINKILKKKPDYIKFKGAGHVNVGFGSKWQEYNFYMHNIIEHLDRLNDYKKIILWDRGLTEVVYGNNEFLRIVKSHIKKFVIYINVDISILTERISSDNNANICKKQNIYIDTIKQFPNFVLNTKYISDNDVTTVIKQIEKENIEQKKIC